MNIYCGQNNTEMLYRGTQLPTLVENFLAWVYVLNVQNVNMLVRDLANFVFFFKKVPIGSSI